MKEKKQSINFELAEYKVSDDGGNLRQEWCGSQRRLMLFGCMGNGVTLPRLEKSYTPFFTVDPGVATT